MGNEELLKLLAEKIQSGELLAASVASTLQKNKCKNRGRPKNKIIRPLKPKKNNGRPKSEKSAELKLIVMGYWALLSYSDTITQIEKRDILSKTVMKSRAFVDKAIAKMHKMERHGLFIYVGVDYDGKIIIIAASNEDIERGHFAELLGVSAFTVFNRKFTLPKL